MVWPSCPIQYLAGDAFFDHSKELAYDWCSAWVSARASSSTASTRRRSLTATESVQGRRPLLRPRTDEACGREPEELADGDQPRQLGQARRADAGRPRLRHGGADTREP